MVKVFVNNKLVIVPNNTSVLEACETIGVQIPRFCYHERLNVAGNCRMCLVEIQNAPKPVASCAWPVSPEMRVFTDTPLVQKARESVLEFLLINHPLDCPICDQGGECDLQEQTLAFGSDRSRFFYAKRGVEDKNCGPLIKTIMTRCIHCTRCVRFFQNIVGKEDLGTTARGTETEIGTYIGKSLNTELSGNVIDLCPVGALTSKPYAFAARPWEIKGVETIDISDSVGSNIKVNFKETEILRVLPVLNDTLNEEWISDKTRFSFDGLKNQRIAKPLLKVSKDWLPSTWEDSLEIFHKNVNKFFEKNSATSRTARNYSAAVVCGNQTDLETSNSLHQFASNLNVPFLIENEMAINSNLLNSAKCSTTFTDILSSDLCLLVGTNPRFEASLLNVRLRKRMVRGLFTVGTLGLTEDLTYKSENLGISVENLVAILEGKHPFCQKLAKAEKPIIILGESALKRKDGVHLQQVITNLSKNMNIISEEWVGLNFLPTTASSVGNSYLGLNNIQKKKNHLKNVQFFFGVGLDDPKKFLDELPTTCFSVCQTAYSDASLLKTNLILPGASFVEKEGTYLNLEGRAQKTEIGLTTPDLARSDVNIIRALSEYNLLENSPKQAKTSFLDIDNNKISFTKNLLVKPVLSKKLFKNSFKGVISDFFLTNAITNNSKIMAKCSANFRKSFTNF
jgi:NADH dehydrogenase (ubiquinone) Fe-S protein 1